MKKQEKLPKRFKERWVRALRSGKYKQASSVLYEYDLENGENCYCCLGVAGKICGIDNDELEDWVLYNNDSAIHKLAIKKKVPKLLLGDNSKGCEDYNPIVEKLTSYNDSGKSFKWIAAYIERYL